MVVAAAATVVLLLAWAGYGLVPAWLRPAPAVPMDDYQKLAIGGFSSIIGAILFSIFKPLREELETSGKELYALAVTPACRIFIFGPSGVGKSTLVRRVVALRQSPAQNEPETQKGFSVYHMAAPLDLQASKEIPVQFSDFRGQKPGKHLFIDGPMSFFGFPGRRRINVIVFMVDLFPAYNDPVTKKPLGTDEIVLRFGPTAAKIIEDRYQQILRYISELSIETVFELAYSSRNLFAVRLLINKLDLLEALEKSGHVDLGAAGADVYLRTRFQSLSQEIQNACRENKVEEMYGVRVVSAADRTGVDEFITELFDAYAARNNLR